MKHRSRIDLGLACLVMLIAAQPVAAEEEHPVELKFKIPDVQAVYIEPTTGAAAGEGAFRYRVETSEGTRSLTPESFTRFVYDQHHSRPFWKKLLNVTSPIGIAWVGLGLLGQVLFAGRMLVQWWTSEKEGRSVIPNAFWWMSLTGASMLLVYFIWRKDLVGILGQSTGWLIYARNLYLIYSRSPAATTPA